MCISNRISELAATRPDVVAFRVLRDGEDDEVSITWSQLEQRSRQMALRLAQCCNPGARVVLVLPTSLEFIVALAACWNAGLVAVPIEPPRPRRRPERLAGIIADCLPELVLTCGQFNAQVEEVVAAGGPAVACVEDLATEGFKNVAALRSPCDLALLQYTSGSTGNAKGVRVSHANFLANAAALADGWALTADDAMVSWLPLFHDMGLVVHVITPIHIGCLSILMPSMCFIQRPLRWLRTIHRWRGTVTGSPDFGYALAANKIRPADLADYDLTCLRVAYSGAEPVRPATIAAFSALTAPAGFRVEGWLPCYGLAEATVFVSGRRTVPREVTVDASALEAGRVIPVTGSGRRVRTLIACGAAATETEIRITNPETRKALGDGYIGEIWIRGPGVADGYFAAPDGSRHGEAFDARGADGSGRWLRTGDLGFLDNGDLVIAGRLKDLVIIRGRNHHPVDIEATAGGAHPAIMPGRLAAFGVEDGVRERMVLLAEINPRVARRLDGAVAEEIRVAIRSAVSAHHDIEVEVIFVKLGAILTTSSGKIRRSASRSAWQAGRLPILDLRALDPQPVTECRMSVATA